MCETSRSTPNVERDRLNTVESPGRGTPVSEATTSRSTPSICTRSSSTEPNRSSGLGAQAFASSR